MHRPPKACHFWPVAAAVFLTDCATKAVAVHDLTPAQVPHPIVGDVLRFTLSYNRGSAMSLVEGPLATGLLSLAALVALVTLWIWYRRGGASAGIQITALALLWGGAAGNLWNRLWSTRGVVDFIDVGVGSFRFWIFNFADAAITVGALLLALVVSRQPSRHGCS
ncbi:MAG: signal peptidase II [Gemmatimonadota bacterium]